MDERQITQWTSDSSAPNSFQVVRQEFFSHTREPMLTFSRCRIHVNAVCLTKFEGAMGVQVLIDQEARVLALRPGQEGCGMSGRGAASPAENVGPGRRLAGSSLRRWQA